MAKVLEIEDWSPPGEPMRLMTMLAEVEYDGESRKVLRRFELGEEWVQWTRDEMRKALLRSVTGS